MFKKTILAAALAGLMASTAHAGTTSWGNALVEVDGNGVAILNASGGGAPVGAATEAKQDAQITALGLLSTEATLSALSAKIAALGQATMAGSMPVAIASDQSAIPVTQSGAWSVGLTGAIPTGANTIGGVTQSGTWTFTGASGSLFTLEDTAAAFKTVTGGQTSINTNETHCWNCDDSFTATGTIPGIAVTTERITATGTTAIATSSDHAGLVGIVVQQDTDAGGASLCEIEVDGAPVLSFRFDRSQYIPLGEKFIDLDATTAIDVVITAGGASFDGAVTVSYYVE